MHSRGELSDKPRRQATFKGLMRAAAQAQSVSFQRVDGQFKKMYRVLSYLRMPLFVDSAGAFLRDLIAGRMVQAPRPSRADRRQTTFRFNA
jgi:hypothetical protein